MEMKSKLRLASGECLDELAIVGECLDCNKPYDVYSGLVVCTVCRLPVLVCPVCAVNKCYPGEFHCYRYVHV
jgi:hypothetical protein